MMLLTISLELVEHIIEQVDCPSDLASLSAVCKALKHSISPGPGTVLGRLQCCYLSVTLDNDPVFTLLASRPQLARAVRRLRILDSTYHVEGNNRPKRDYFWNEHGLGEIQDSDGETNPQLVHAAVGAMKNLEYLCFRDVPISPTLDWSFLFGHVFNLFPRLRNVYLGLLDADDEEIAEEPTFPNLQDLGTLISLSLTMPEHYTVSLTSFDTYVTSTLMSLSTAVRCLSLECNSETLEKIYGLRFTALQSLSLAHCGEDGPEYYGIASFLGNHPTIRALNVGYLLPDVLPEDCLPCLEEFCAGNIWWNVLQPLSNGALRPLRWFDVTMLSLRTKKKFLQAAYRLLQSLHTLDGLWMETFTESAKDNEMLSELGKIIPGVRAVCFGLPSHREGVQNAGLPSKLLPKPPLHQKLLPPVYVAC